MYEYVKKHTLFIKIFYFILIWFECVFKYKVHKFILQITAIVHYFVII